MDLKLTNSDLDITNGELTLLSGADAIAQHLQIRLRLFKGEWFLDADEGMPYYESILIKNPRPSVLRSIFKRVIEETPGVEEALSLEFDFDASARSLALTFKARVTGDETLTFERFVVNV